MAEGISSDAKRCLSVDNEQLAEVSCFNGQSDWNPWNAVISRVKDLTMLKRCEQIVRLEKRTDMIGDADVCGITVIAITTVIVVTTVIAITTTRAESRE